MQTNKTRSDDEDREWYEIEAAKKDPSAFEAIYIRYFKPVFKFIYRFLKNKEIVADIVHEVFLLAMLGISAYTHQNGGFSCWLFRIAGSVLKVFSRSKRKEKLIDIDPESFEQLADAVAAEPEDRFAALLKEARDTAVRKAMTQLKPDERNLIRMRFYKEMRFHAIAHELNISEELARQKMQRVLKKMKKLIRKSGQK